jgi:streptogramin lyase
MAGRDHLLCSSRRVSQSTVIVALVMLSLVLAVGVELHRTTAKHSNSGTSHPSGLSIFTSSQVIPARSAPISPSGLGFQLNEGTRSVLVGEFDGRFDAGTRRLTIQPKGSRIFSGVIPGGEVPQGSGFSFNVINSTFINSGDNPATVSSEIQITNNTGSTLFNTRLVFTSFKIGGSSGTNAGHTPSGIGFAYFNDGQVPYDGRLNVSRLYGDIPTGSSTRNIWTFAVTNQPPNFFFSYKVLADIGVAAESVQPAAVQVNALSGASVVINGRGFTGTPVVELLPGTGAPIAITVASANATQITAVVPAGTPEGIYSVRVTNPGGTPGGAGSSTIARRLTITGIPDEAHTIFGVITSIGDTGPYLISGNATIDAVVDIPAGAVIYVSSGATITVSGGGNIIANGGIPGVPGGGGVQNPAQIVLTAQRAPGAGLPTAGSWGGIDATSASSAEAIMRNFVVEYGGVAGSAQIVITGSGRKLRFIDSIARSSAGSGIAAGGANDSLEGFSRNRIENNGSSLSDPAMLLSANAALGLYDLDSSTGGTSVGDPSYYYSSANDFAGNQVNAIQIGKDADDRSNDFTRSGVLVGQSEVPIQLRGSSSNPAIVGAAPPGSPVELAINATAIIHLAAGMDLQAGDYPTNRVGSIAANGYAGFYLGSQGATSNEFIEFDKMPSNGNFGAIFIGRNALTNCILNYVRVRNGGASLQGNGEVIVEANGLKVINSQINNSASGGLLELLSASIDARGTSFSGNAQIIDTIAGGVLGDGNLSVTANLVTPAAVVADPLGRGVYLVDAPPGISYIRFLNTTRHTINIAGHKIPGGTLKNIAGGGLDPGENIPGTFADVGIVTGIAVSPNAEIVYFIDAGYPAIRALNVSDSSKTIAGAGIGPGRIGTFAAAGFGSAINGLAVDPTNGDVFVADATAGNNKIFKFTVNNPSVSTAPVIVAGTGATTKAEDSFPGGAATTVPLLQPRAIVFDSARNLYIADTGHARIIKVDSGGMATLVAQFPPKADPAGKPYTNNPYPSGLAFFNGKLIIANGNAQDVSRIDVEGSPTTLTLIAGTIGQVCDYSVSKCGDGGPAKQSGLSLIGSTAAPPLAGIAVDSQGLFILDQGSNLRGRVRYVNLGASPTEVAGVTIGPGNIGTIAGTGNPSPYDGGLATSAGLDAPLGVAIDPKGNLWIADTLSSKLRFVNRGASAIKIFADTLAEQVVPPGMIVSVNKDAGAGQTDDAPANRAGFDTPQGITATSEGLYIADSKKGPSTQGSSARRTGFVRFINTSNQTVSFYPASVHRIDVPPGHISTIAGGGNENALDNPGNGANPLLAKFVGLSDIAIAPNGDIYIADAGQRLVRKIERSSGTVSSLTLPGTSPNEYTGIGFDSAGRLLVANAGNKQILREVAPNTGAFTSILGGGLLSRPRDVVEGKDGNLYVTNAGDPSPLSTGDHRIIRIVVSGGAGTASILTGSLSPGYGGDGGPVANALINITPQPINVASLSSAVLVRTTVNIAIGPAGEVVFADSINNAIRRIR